MATAPSEYPSQQPIPPVISVDGERPARLPSWPAGDAIQAMPLAGSVPAPAANGAMHGLLHTPAPEPVAGRHGEHGGADALGVARHDFSTNANACGPCPLAAQAVAQADASHYPDPEYASLIGDLSTAIGVYPDRILLAASASECIARLTAAVTSLFGRTDARPGVWVPTPAYGDYARAARPWGLPLVERPAQAALVWHCEPASPTGQGLAAWRGLDDARPEQVWVLDAAYEPLRLDGHGSLTVAQRERVWQMFSPNKSLGLTGVRAAYLIAPSAALETGSPAWRVAQRMRALAPSWPIGAHGVAMLKAWVQPEVQHWLSRSLDQLRKWRQAQNALLRDMGWAQQPSDSPFGVARPPLADAPATTQGDGGGKGHGDLAAMLAFMRARGVKLRDTASMGLPGWLRLSVRPPADQDALRDAWQAFLASRSISTNAVSA
jgi:histidinol-phosphate aminotransferase